MKKSIFIVGALLLSITAIAFATPAFLTAYISAKPVSWDVETGDLNTSNLSQPVTAPAVPPRTKNLPDEQFFDVLFNTVLSMDRAAGKLKSEGKNGDIWSKYLEQKAALTTAEMSHLRQIASDFELEMTPLQKRAMSLINERRKAVSEGKKFGSPSGELQVLQATRESISKRYGRRLLSSFDSKTVDRLRNALTGNLSEFELSPESREMLIDRLKEIRMRTNEHGGQTNE